MHRSIDPMGLVVFGIAIFALRAATSCWWLARYNAGPAEWLCHSLVSGSPQAMRRHDTASVRADAPVRRITRPRPAPLREEA
ncbi:DUF418 domain-containing protein [Variovorax boronicumulans]|uniref:DUF418 domain-containing protein n=1 Tax=Variovorax boronicumulans TaxID=436515 RepID=UPI0027D77C8E|nr:DUF418 domain-containing protein [Variovorax boronicumulans]